MLFASQNLMGGGVQLLPAPPDWQGPGFPVSSSSTRRIGYAEPQAAQTVGWDGKHSSLWAVSSVQFVKHATLFVKAYFLNI